jgi:hypothetical protein
MLMYDSNGNVVDTLSELSTPRGVAVDVNGDIFIGNDLANDVKVYNYTSSTSQFDYISTLGATVQKPSAIEIDSTGKIYVVDTNTHQVMIFNPDLSLLTSFGVAGSGDGQLWYPKDLALDEIRREIVILDKGGPEAVRIQAFDLDTYSWIRTVAQSSGLDIGQMQTPVGVELDTEGRVYISDSAKEGIQVLNGSNGNYLGGVYDADHQLSNAAFLTISRDNQLFAVSSGAVNAVERYQLTMTSQDIDVTPSSHDFGGVNIGSTENKIFTVKNVGAEALDITSVSTTADPPFRVVTHTCGSPVSSLGTCTIEVEFAPASGVSYAEDLVINSDDPDEGAFSVALSGSGIEVLAAEAGGPYGRGR